MIRPLVLGSVLFLFAGVLTSCEGDPENARTETPSEDTAPMAGPDSPEAMGGTATADPGDTPTSLAPNDGDMESNPMTGGHDAPGLEEAPHTPVVTTELDVESPWLEIPFDDPTDPRTVSAVMGIRRVEAMDPEIVRLVFGPAFSVSDAQDNPEGFNIYSPDDERYAHDLFVEPSAMSHSTFDDVAEAPEDRFGTLGGHMVTLTLPHPMTVGARYFFRALGGRRTTLEPDQHHQSSWEGYPITGGRTASGLVFGEETSPNDALTDDVISEVMGLRTLERIAPDMVRLVLGGGTVSANLDTPGSFELSSTDDENYTTAQNPLATGRRTYPELFTPNYGYPFTRRFDRNEVYLKLPHPLVEGMAYTVTLAETVTTGRRRLSLTYSDHTVLNPHLKVNQEGYPPQGPVKTAYLGAWMGTLGPLVLTGEAPVCELVNAGSGEVVWSGSFTLRHTADAVDEGPLRQANLTRENLYTCDFSEWEEPGSYYIKVPGMGRSYGFEISHEVYLNAFRVSMRGLLYQRAGQGLDETLSKYRKPKAHTEPVEIPYMDDKPIIGGHYDAGDYNPRAHYEVAHLLMLAYEMFPEKFSDAQVGVPEAGNGIPDILDEAAWAIRPFMALQDTDGGVGGRDDGVSIESRSDPSFVMTPERDPYIQESYDKHPKASFILAALGAAAARSWTQVDAPDQAALYLEAARRAFGWAMENGPDRAPVFQAWAAAELAHATGEASFTDAFRDSGFTLGNPLDDGGADRMRPIMAYALNTHPMADAELRDAMVAGIANIADTFGQTSERFAYPHFQHPWAPVTWGTGAYPHRIEPAILAYKTTGDEKYLRWMLWSADFVLGVNPLNYTWITGLGDRPVYGPAHLWGWNTYQGVIPPGLQTEGPNQRAEEVARWNPAGVPAPDETPPYYNYHDVRYHIGLNEGVVTSMAWTTFLFAALLP